MTLTDQQKKEIVENYIRSYNSFDVPGMIADLAEDVIFRNISQGEVSLELRGKNKFKDQAIHAIAYFSERKQTITKWSIDASQVVVDLDYQATLAMDLPNGLKEGGSLQLKGRSIFEFEGSKIIALTDES
ncbi:nuclear transport factor 2 family protein [Algoriphagus namhaensis]